MVQFPPTEEDLRNPLRCASLVPESSAVPRYLTNLHKRRYEADLDYAQNSELRYSSHGADKRPRLENSFDRSIDPDRPIASREGQDGQITPSRSLTHVDAHNPPVNVSHISVRGSAEVGGQEHSFNRSRTQAYNPYGTPTSSSVLSPKHASQQPNPISIPDSPQRAKNKIQGDYGRSSQFEPVSPKSESPELTTSIHASHPLSVPSRENIENDPEPTNPGLPVSPLHFDEMEGVISSLPEESFTKSHPAGSDRAKNLVTAKSDHSKKIDSEPIAASSDRIRRSPSQIDMNPSSQRHGSPSPLSHNSRKDPTSPKSLKVINGIRQRARSVMRPASQMKQRSESPSDNDALVEEHDPPTNSSMHENVRGSRRDFVHNTSQAKPRATRTTKHSEIGVLGNEKATSERIENSSDIAGKSAMPVNQDPQSRAETSVRRQFNVVSSPGGRSKSQQSAVTGEKEQTPSNPSTDQPVAANDTTSGLVGRNTQDMPAKQPKMSKSHSTSRDPSSISSDLGKDRNERPDDASVSRSITKKHEEPQKVVSISPSVAPVAGDPSQVVEVTHVDDLKSQPWVQALLKKSDEKEKLRKKQASLQKKLRQNTSSNAGSANSNMISTLPGGSGAKHVEHLRAERAVIDDPAGSEVLGHQRADFLPKRSKGDSDASHTPRIRTTESSTTSRGRSEDASDNNVSKRSTTFRSKFSGSMKSQMENHSAEGQPQPTLAPNRRSTTPAYPSSSVKRPSALKRPIYAPSSSQGAKSGDSDRFLASHEVSHSLPTVQRRSVSWPDDPVSIIDSLDEKETRGKAPVGKSNRKIASSRSEGNRANLSKDGKTSEHIAKGAKRAATPKMSLAKSFNEAVELSSDSDKSISPFISGDEEEDLPQVTLEKEKTALPSKAGPSISSQGSNAANSSLASLLALKGDRVQLPRGSRSPAKFVGGDVDHDSSIGSDSTSPSVAESTSETDTGSALNVNSQEASHHSHRSSLQDEVSERLSKASNMEDDKDASSRQEIEIDLYSRNKPTSPNDRSNVDREANEQLLRESQASLPSAPQLRIQHLSHSGASKVSKVPDTKESIPSTSSSEYRKAPNSVPSSRFTSFTNLKNSRNVPRPDVASAARATKQGPPIQLDESESSDSDSSVEEGSDDNRPRKQRNRNATALKNLMECKFHGLLNVPREILADIRQWLVVPESRGFLYHDPYVRCSFIL